MELLTYTIVGTVIGTLLAIEAKAWLPYLSAALVRSTLRKIPDALNDELRSRWCEEIEADLFQYEDRPLSGFLFALRLRRRGGKRLAEELLLEEHLAPRAPSAEEDEYADSPVFLPALIGVSFAPGEIERTSVINRFATTDTKGEVSISILGLSSGEKRLLARELRRQGVGRGLFR